ncbi:MAG TPA: zf-HC2 domain-containing protein [Thermoanaerobaculia bacterium]|nr:zf-HC2 domain-containing protein [Thermoanaerobaculia bacterium]
MSDDAKNLRRFSSPAPLPDPEEHPHPDRLYAYHANELTPEEDLELQEHLALCGHCTELLLDIQGFSASPSEEPAGLSEFEQAADWRKLRTRLDQDGFFTRGRRPRQKIVAVAAVFVLAVVGFSIYSLTRRVEAEIPTVTLDPLNSTRGEAPAVVEVKPPVKLVLKSSAESPYPEYKAEIHELPGDRIVKSVSELHQNDSFEVEVRLGRGELKRGQYRLDLLGRSNGRLAEVASYAFRITKEE